MKTVLKISILLYLCIFYKFTYTNALTIDCDYIENLNKTNSFHYDFYRYRKSLIITDISSFSSVKFNCLSAHIDNFLGFIPTTAITIDSSLDFSYLHTVGNDLSSIFL